MASERLIKVWNEDSRPFAPIHVPSWLKYFLESYISNPRLSVYLSRRYSLSLILKPRNIRSKTGRKLSYSSSGATKIA
jgi:hypothetical protein